MEFRPIGVIHTPFAKLQDMPIQAVASRGATGTVEVLEEYRAGLKDLDGFSHVILLYHFHSSQGFNLQVVPFLDTRPRGLFATRAPKRPNPIGLSVVALQKIEGGVLHVKNIDMLDGTPLLDIKPYVPRFDAPANCITGWLAKVENNVANQKSDDRFT